MRRTFLCRLQNPESPCDSVPLRGKMNLDFFWGKEIYLCPLHLWSSKHCFPSHPMASPGIPAVTNSCYTGMLFCLLGFSLGSLGMVCPVGMLLWLVECGLSSTSSWGHSSCFDVSSCRHWVILCLHLSCSPGSSSTQTIPWWDSRSNGPSCFLLLPKKPKVKLVTV